LPLDAQTKLLRVLQDQKVTRVGGSQPKKVDVRIIAATNRTLMDEVTAKNFREDLFYRLAVAVINLPALRDRGDDLELITEYLLRVMNEEYHFNKTISDGARKVLRKQSWPGNIRELQNILLRALIWSPGSVVTEKEIQDALFGTRRRVDVLNRAIGRGFSLPGVLDEVRQHYLLRARDESQRKKKAAADLLGLKSYQHLDQMLARFKIKWSDSPSRTIKKGSGSRD
jgi:DNA-binding NtrC family response regulator